MTEFSKQCRKCLYVRSRLGESPYHLSFSKDGRYRTNRVIFIDNICGHPFEFRIINGFKVCPPSDRVILEEQENIPCNFFESRPHQRRTKTP